MHKRNPILVSISNNADTAETKGPRDSNQGKKKSIRELFSVNLGTDL